MRDARRSAPHSTLHSIQWGGHPVYYRPGTSDTGIIYDVLLKRGRKGEYWIPDAVAPRVILDIGGNIGTTSVYFANRFPDARIFTFEPVQANFAILTKNIAPYPNVRAFPVALGARDDRLAIRTSSDPNNFGGFSFYPQGSCDKTETQVTVKAAPALLHDLGIASADLIKIDTEGSEFMILTALGKEILAKVRWIIGELHGERDFELLAFLENNFDIDVRKALKKRLFMFNACNKNFTRQVAI